MPIVATQTGGNRVPVPAGNHLARCIKIIEVGTLQQTYEGKTTQVYKIRIAWELPSTQHVFDDTKGPQPFVMEVKRTLSLNDRARLRQELESWRGVAFTAEELKAFDLTKLVGAPCMLNIIHTEDGYERIQSITPIPAGLEAPAQINPSFILSYDDPAFLQKYDTLPEWLRDEIGSTPEFKAKTGQVPTVAAPTQQQQQAGFVNTAPPAQAPQPPVQSAPAAPAPGAVQPEAQPITTTEQPPF